MSYRIRKLTDLYHDHAKSEDVPFPSGFIASPEDLWRGPRRSISLCTSYGIAVRSPDNCGEPEIRQTRVAVIANENVGLGKGHQCDQNDPGKILAPFKSPCIVKFA